MLNRHQLGRLYLGVRKNGDIAGQRLPEEHKLCEITIPICKKISPIIFPIVKKYYSDDGDVISIQVSGIKSFYRTSSKYYMRIGNENKVININTLEKYYTARFGPKQWEYQDSGVSIENLDTIRFKKFYRESIASGYARDISYSKLCVLNDYNFIYYNNLTNACNMLFGKNGPLSLKLATYSTNDKSNCIDIKKEKGNIFELISLGEEYIIQHIFWRVEREWIKRIDVPEISVKLIRELLANSFIHTIYNSNTIHEINIHPEKIVVYNYGQYIYDFSDTDITKIQSSLRNECIAKIMHLSNLTYEFGECLTHISTLCNQEGLKYKFENTESGFKATIYRRSLDDTWFNITSKDLSHDEKAVLDLLQQNPRMSNTEIANSILKSVGTVQRITRSLHAKLRIRRNPSEHTAWIVLDK